MSWRRRLMLGAAAAMLAGSVPAFADTSCSVNSTGLTFGAYNPRRPTTSSVGVIRVDCTDASGYLIKLSPGSSGNAAMRAMQNGASILNYNLWKDGARSMIWGDGASGLTGVNGSGTANYNVYGGVFGGQSPFVGAYVDTIIISVEY